MTQDRRPVRDGGRPADDDDWEDNGDWDQIPRSKNRARSGGDDRDEDDDRYDSRGRRIRRKSSNPNTAIILAAVGWLLCPICSPIAIILGIMEISAAQKNGDPAPGTSVAAIVLGSISTLGVGCYIALMTLSNY